MWKRFNNTDRRILGIALLLLLAFSYFLYDDSLLFSDDSTANLKKIGAISHTDRDVRRKISRQFLWKSARQQEKVHLGDSLFTGKDSSAKVKLDDGRELTVQQNSLVTFSNVDGQFVFDLQSGKVSGEIVGQNCMTLLLNGNKTEVCGQDSKLELDADGSVKVLSGQAEVKGAQVAKIDEIQWAPAPPQKFYHVNHSPSLRLSWKSDKYHGRYRVQFSKQKAFSTISFEQITKQKSISLKNYPSQGSFYIRIQGDDVKGEGISYTSIGEIEFIKTKAPRITYPETNQTLSYRLNHDGELSEPNRTEIKWDYANAEADLEVQLSKTEDFSEVVEVSKKANGGQILSPELEPGNYYVRVREGGADAAEEKPWSQVVPFIVEFNAPEKMKAPVLLSENIRHPANSETAPKLSWTAVEEAAKYIVEVSTDPDFTKRQAFSTKGLAMEYKKYTPGEYYVRVFPATEKGTVGEPSNIGKMNIQADRPILNPVEPKSVMGKTPDDPGDPQDFNVSWSNEKFADSYVIQISPDKEFKEKIQYESRSPSSVVQVPKPGEFFWRVQPLDDKGKPLTEFSDPGQISYNLMIPLTQPTLTEPGKDVTLFFQKSSTPYFWLEWQEVKAAQSYRVEVSTSANFEAPVISTVSTSPRFLIKEKLPQGTLYWRVRAEGDNNRISHWSEPRRMSIFAGRKAQRE